MARTRIALVSAATIVAATSFLMACGTDDAAVEGAPTPGATNEASGTGSTAEPANAGDANAAAPARTVPQGTSSAADARIASAVLMRLVAERDVDARAFDVRVEAGVVTLTPDAGTSSEVVTRASSIAQGVDGVVRVAVAGAGAAEPALAPDAAALQEALDRQVNDGPLDATHAGGVDEVLAPPAALATPEVPVEAPAEAPADAPTSADGTPSSTTTATPEGEGATTSYTVRRGDSLSVIASRQLGDGTRWNEIYRMNRAIIGANPDGVREGMVLQLPPRR